MNIATTATLVMLLLLPACATNVRFFPVVALKDEPFSARQAPATVTKESKETLTQQGYVTIGWVGTANIVKTCADAECSSFNCTKSGTVADGLVGELLAQASKHGGDLVDVRLNEIAVNELPHGWQKCSQFGTAFRNRGVSSPLSDSGVWGWFHECIKWARTSGSECVAHSGGVVWRREPELVPRVTAAERDQFDAENERARLLGEAVKNREIYAALHNMHAANTVRIEPDLQLYQAGNKFGFRDTSGAVVIAPMFAGVLRGFSEGLAAAAIDLKGKRRWGFIDRTGTWIIQPRFDRVSDFSEGLAGAEEYGRAGFIDRDGNFVIKPMFDHASAFSIGIAEVEIYGKTGFYDRRVRKLFTLP